MVVPLLSDLVRLSLSYTKVYIFRQKFEKNCCKLAPEEQNASNDRVLIACPSREESSGIKTFRKEVCSRVNG